LFVYFYIQVWDVVGNVHPPPLFCLLIDAKCITHKMPCVLRLCFSTFDPPCFAWAYFTQILIFLNVVNCNGCAHIRAIIFILTSNSGNPTLEFQWPLSHYVFKHRLVYLDEHFDLILCAWHSKGYIHFTHSHHVYFALVKIHQKNYVLQIFNFEVFL
jgi:hypothetical protein